MSRIALLTVGVTCFALLLEVVAAPGLKEPPNDLKKLQGDWTIESWVQVGQAVQMQATWTFKSDKYTLDMAGNREEGNIKLDKQKKHPTIDLAITEGTCQGKDQPGIYKLDGDTLTLCFSWPGVADRPTDFASTADNRWILITLKRKK